jgi:predicted PurR-regulated permease PerM
MKRLIGLLMLSLCFLFLLPEGATASPCAPKQINKLQKQINRMEAKILKIERQKTKATRGYDKQMDRHQRNLANFSQNSLNLSWQTAQCLARGNGIVACATIAAQALARAQKRWNKLQQRGQKITQKHNSKMNLLEQKKEAMLAHLATLQANLAACGQ